MLMSHSNSEEKETPVYRMRAARQSHVEAYLPTPPIIDSAYVHVPPTMNRVSYHAALHRHLQMTPGRPSLMNLDGLPLVDDIDATLHDVGDDGEQEAPPAKRVKLPTVTTSHTRAPVTTANRAILPARRRLPSVVVHPPPGRSSDTTQKSEPSPTQLVKTDKKKTVVFMSNGYVDGHGKHVVSKNKPLGITECATSTQMSNITEVSFPPSNITVPSKTTFIVNRSADVPTIFDMDDSSKTIDLTSELSASDESVASTMTLTEASLPLTVGSDKQTALVDDKHFAQIADVSIIPKTIVESHRSPSMMTAVGTDAETSSRPFKLHAHHLILWALAFFLFGYFARVLHEGSLADTRLVYDCAVHPCTTRERDRYIAVVSSNVARIYAEQTAKREMTSTVGNVWQWMTNSVQ